MKHAGYFVAHFGKCDSEPPRLRQMLRISIEMAAFPIENSRKVRPFQQKYAAYVVHGLAVQFSAADFQLLIFLSC